MEIVMHCEPNTPPMLWSQFLKMAPVNSIAIDGYVIGRPRYDSRRSIMNANHHEEVDRFSTRCTAAQILILIRTGLLQSFSTCPQLHVFFNDCDQDVCLAINLLKNAVLSRQVVNPIYNRIAFIEDMLDTTGGTYAFPADLDGMKENNWIFEPYTTARRNGVLTRRDPAEFLQVVELVNHRINQTLVGKGEHLPLDTRYRLLANHSNWRLVEEQGLNARTGIYADGITAFVSVRVRPLSRFTYTLCRSGIWIPFNIPEMIKALNKEEGDPINRWGGGTTIAGSPRATGSRLTPEEVTAIVAKCLN